MDQQREHIVLRLEGAHIILKTARVHRDMPAAQHVHDIRPQTVKVHVHIDLQRVIDFRGGPVIGKTLTEHRLHHRLRVIDMMKLPEHISVIPAPHLGKIHVIPFAQRFHLNLGKTSILLQYPLVCHGVLCKHIQRGVLSVFFHRQDSCHIGERDIGLILQKIPQKIKILLLQRLRLLPLTHHTVPLIDQKDELPLRPDINSLKRLRQNHYRFRKQIPIFFPEILYYNTFQIFDHLLLPCPDQKLLHIQIDHIIPVQMFLKSLITLYFPPPEQIPGVAAAAIVGIEHFQCHGFSETARSADTHIFLFCIHVSVRICDQSGLVHIDLRAGRFPETVVVRVQIDSHNNASRFSHFPCHAINGLPISSSRATPTARSTLPGSNGLEMLAYRSVSR